MYESAFKLQGDRHMTENNAQRLIEKYVKPIYGFCLKRCKTLEDAQDLAQETALKAYRTLILRDDIDDPDRFIWTIAHNALSNYYRDFSRSSFGAVNIDELSETLASADGHPIESLIEAETVAKLKSEIAYLSKLQRWIVIAYYFEGKKLEDIASGLNIPAGTVKWHLFEARKDLKRGMETMRNTSDLKFNPIKFLYVGTSGCPGTKGADKNFFRSRLAQNIAYCVWKEAKTVNEIAEDLGVSPVYVEEEAEYLAEYGYLKECKGKYLCNILIEEPTAKLIKLRDEIYSNAAKLIANELYDELSSSDILNDPNIWGGKTGKMSFTEDTPRDKNYLLWSLIPYISANSGKELYKEDIRFEDVSTVRPDGGNTICTATVENESVRGECESDWCGICWNESDNLTLWQLDTNWSEHRVNDSYHYDSMRVISLLKREYEDGKLSPDEYAFLSQRGLINVLSDGGNIKTAYRCIWLEGEEIERKLLDIGTKIKQKHASELEKMNHELESAFTKDTPKHLVKMQKYGLQHIFYSNSNFVISCLKELISNGRLKAPKEEEKISLTTVIINRR